MADKKIFWDKGHGGVDPGAVGNGLLEKILTHKIVQYAMDYMDLHFTGFVQKASRAGDQALSLAERTNAANAFKADVLVSIHINSANDNAANGFESFVYTNPGSATIALQNMIHAEVFEAMKKFGVTKDRGKKRAIFHMLRESKMAAVLTENLFIVNTADANKLKNEAFLKAVGEAHARAVAKYLGLANKPVSKPTTPIASTSGNYTIKSGDSFWKLETNNKWAVGTLQKLNPGVDPGKLQIGQKINVPGSATAAAPKPQVVGNVGKLVVVNVASLNVRKKPSWDASAVDHAVTKGAAFTIVEELAEFYKLKSGLYITKSSKYVSVK